MVYWLICMVWSTPNTLAEERSKYLQSRLKWICITPYIFYSLAEWRSQRTRMPMDVLGNAGPSVKKKILKLKKKEIYFLKVEHVRIFRLADPVRTQPISPLHYIHKTRSSLPNWDVGPISVYPFFQNNPNLAHLRIFMLQNTTRNHF
jgi:hypothetical protein